MHGKDFEDKKECDLCNKQVKNKRDYILHDSSCKHYNVRGLVFVFEKKDLDGKSTEDLGVWVGDGIGQGGNNFILLICQYKIIIRSIIKQTLWRDSCI